jgi:hypothetical protein
VSVEEEAVDGVDRRCDRAHGRRGRHRPRDTLAFATTFAKAVVASGLDSDAPGPGAATLDAELEKCSMGELPDDNDQDVAQDTMFGFRSMGRTLADLFDVDFAGSLAPRSSIGANVD